MQYVNMKNILFLILILFASCSSCKVAKQSPIREIQFGSGGGFTGAVTTYSLKADGSLWKQDKILKKLPCDSLSVIYDIVEQLPHEDYIYPGNTYLFIRIVSHDTSYYYTWTCENIPDGKIVDLYNKLNKQL